ncbi:MAG: LTA synthase family protein [Paludibacteraceae bacterium]|nr:LTA synthase family protein [Paludibacteraceae bacterium]
MKQLYKWLKNQPIFALVVNLLIMMVVFMVCRLFFFAVNHNFFTDMTVSHFVDLCLGGIQFDRTAVIYTNVVVILLMLLPLRNRNSAKYQKAVKWVFVIFNGLALSLNMYDTGFFAFTNRRSTFSIFSEFKNENNLGGIFLKSMVDYWYIFLFFFFLLFVLWKVFYRPSEKKDTTRAIIYYPIQTLVAAAVVGLVIAGARGGFTRDVRPITLSNANQYVNKSTEAGIVLNTPFCMYRTLNKKVYKNPNYFATEEELDKVFTPVVHPQPKGEFKNLNVVVLILESFGKEHSGFFNQDLEGGKYKGFTPFLDSLYQQGYTFRHSYATGRVSIDAMPSVLSSIPMFEQPFILTPYSNNSVNSIASELNKKGYYTAFFHGAPNGSMGFQAYAKLAGFKDYYGMTEYGHDEDFDGNWAIWDEEFLQYYANTMATFKEPFMTAVFTASSHHPFNVPERYVGKFPEGGSPLCKCVAYSDNALRRFFATASKMPWYKNTLFVVTADHTNQQVHEEYFTDEKLYSVPILFYQPGNDSLKGMSNELASQTDIMPSILNFLNYDQPYLAFGRNVLTGSDSAKYVVNYNSPLYQILQGEYLMQWDGEQTVSLYNLRTDPKMQKNLKGTLPIQQEMEQNIKAQIQQYMVRMVQDRLNIQTDQTNKR